jgi:hypothetical protein
MRNRWSILTFWVLVGGAAWAQQTPPARPSSAERDSVRFSNLRQNMKKRNLTGQLYNLLFRYPYNTNQNQELVKEIPRNPFSEYEGRVIRHIRIQQLDVFGPSVYDTLRKASNWIERTGNRLHRDTRERVLRKSFLLFDEGDVLNPQVVWDNERLLRQSPIIHDARIVVLPDARFSNIVDILVLVQDTWSLTPRSVRLSGPNNLGMVLEQRNRRGLAHTVFHGLFYNGNAARGSRLEYTGGYVIPNIRKSFITAEANLQLFRDNKQGLVRVYRPFLTPQTVYAGSASLSYNRVNNYVLRLQGNDTASVVRIPLSYFYGDAWLGRAFRLNVGNAQLRERGRLVLAARATRFKYYQRPAVTTDTNRLYQNRSTYLMSMGFSNRLYRRDVLIYGFGRTEDVPYGWLASGVVGAERTEFGNRSYLGMQLSQAHYLTKNRGYLYLLANVGTYLRAGQAEQGVISAEANYFSRLFKIGQADVRQFVNVRYVRGINRFNDEYISINNREGIRGLNRDFLIGTRKLTVSLETVLFAPFQTFGFRVATFGFADFALIGQPDKGLMTSRLYQGYGLGFRFRNENLTFNTFSLRLAYYPTVITGNRFGLVFDGETPLRLRDFGVDEPEVVRFR